MLFFLPFLNTFPLVNHDIASMLIGVVLFIGLAVLCYLLLKWFSKKTFSLSRGVYLQVLDRMMVARDIQIAVVRAGERVFLVGITKEGVSPISELNEDDLEPIREPEKAGFVMGLLSRNRGNNAGENSGDTFLKRFIHNFSNLSGAASRDRKFYTPNRQNIGEADESGNTTEQDAAFRDILVKNQSRYTADSDDELETREYEFKASHRAGSDAGDVQKPPRRADSGETPGAAGTRTSEAKSGNPVNKANYSAAIEKMRGFGDMVNTDEPPIKRINEAISKADKYSEPEETLDSVLKSISKRKDKYQKK